MRVRRRSPSSGRKMACGCPKMSVLGESSWKQCLAGQIALCLPHLISGAKTMDIWRRETLSMFKLFSVVSIVCLPPWIGEASLGEKQNQEPIASAETGDAGVFQPVSFNRGWEFRTPNNNFSTALRFRMQNRADFFHRPDPPPGESDWDHEMQVRRMRLRLNGHVVDPRLRYLVQLSFSRRDQDWDSSQQPNVLRDAMITFDATPDLQFGFGQGKLPGNRQRVVSSGDLQFVDRSIVNAAFNVDRDFGFQGQYRLRLEEQIVLFKGAVTSGEGRNMNTASDGRLATTARAEWLPFGEFARQGDYFESDLAFEENPKLSIAYGASSFPGSSRANATVGTIFTEDGTRGGVPARTDQTVQFFDVLGKWQGYSVAAEWARRDASRVAINSRQGVLVGQGFNLQVGKMLTERWEVAARHSVVLPDGVSRGYFTSERDWAVVNSYFLNGHRVKFQGEVGTTEGRHQYVRVQAELGI